jgi:hypothetical protein
MSIARYERPARAFVASIGVGSWIANHGRREERTFNGGIVLVDEMALDQLDSQARLSNTTSTDNDELVLSKELQQSSRQQTRGEVKKEVEVATERSYLGWR